MKKIKPLPFSAYYFPVWAISFLGVINSVYLSVSHYRNYTDIEYISFCALTRTINCDTVSQSSYSIFLNIPVPVWSIIAYVFLFSIIAFAGCKTSDKKRLWASVFFISLLYSVYSIYLAFVSAYYIKSYCILCIINHGINFTVFFMSWIIRRRFDGASFFSAMSMDFLFFRKKKMLLFFLSLVICSPFILWGYLPNYWDLKPESANASNLKTGLTSDGHPWIGAETPKLVIEEFSDYRCFQCKKIHFYLRNLISKRPDEIRLIHRHYPMDNEFNNIVVPAPFHEGSGKLSLIAIYSIYKKNFWDINDILFNLKVHNTEFSLKELSEITGLSDMDIRIALTNKQIRNYLRNDIRSGMKLEITATPALVINNKVYVGRIPSEEIEKALEANGSGK